jgi:hypothetical protein
LAGVLNWHAEVPPAFNTIAGAKCLDQGVAHIKTITETGGVILGLRPLEVDNIVPWEFRGAEYYRSSYVHKGLRQVRPQQPADDSLPVLSTWGYHVAAVIAEARFIKRFP